MLSEVHLLDGQWFSSVWVYVQAIKLSPTITETPFPRKALVNILLVECSDGRINFK